jgi:hypothetical protein
MMRFTLPLLLLFAFDPQPAWSAWNVVESGAVGDGQADCTAIFQKLLDEAAKAGGGTVDVPAGRYKISAALSIPANVTLQGIYKVPPSSGPRAIAEQTGSALLAIAGRGDTNGKPFITLAGNNASIAGFIIAYPEWKQTDVPPAPYPPCIFSQDTENVGVRDCCLLNPYEGIKLVRAHRHLVRNVTGYPIKRGLYVDECYDIGHIENVHYWPFGVAYNPEDPYCKWINTQGVAFEIARADWHYVHNTFCFGYGIGYFFSKSKSGSCNGNFLGLGADSCQRAVVVEQAQAPGLLISNGEFVGRWSSTNAVCLEVGPEAEGKVSLVNCSFWGPIDRCVWMRSPSGQFTASACNFVDWDNAGLGSPAIQIDAGRAIIQGSTFSREKLQVAVGSNVVSALVYGNQAPGGFRIRNHAGRRVQASMNEEDNITWTPDGLACYRILVGAPGDARYLDEWHGSENPPHPFRWSQGKSEISLPVRKGGEYTLEIEISAPPQARDEQAGFYIEGERISALPEAGVWKVNLPKADDDRIVGEIRVKPWIPAKVVPDSGDQRMLGIQVYSILAREKSAAGAKVFNANTGQ